MGLVKDNATAPTSLPKGTMCVYVHIDFKKTNNLINQYTFPSFKKICIKFVALWATARE